MMNMGPRLVQTLRQTQTLSLKMQQALQILQYSNLELDQHIKEELEVNPVLEATAKLSEPVPEITKETPNGHDGEALDDSSFDLDAFASRWDQRLKEGRDLSVHPDMGSRRDFYLNSISQEESLTAHLLTQLRLVVDDPDDLAMGEYLVGEIDARGYFTGSLEEIAEEMGVELAQVERMLYRVQRFEPTGVGARDLAECLMLQINAEHPHEPELTILVEHHLDDLQRRQIPAIAKAMRVSTGRVEELKNILATLNPWPGHEYDSEPTQYIAPDLVVEKIDGSFVVSLTESGSPELQVDEGYKALVKDKTMDKTEKRYIRSKLESAKWLIQNIAQRQQTILRIGKAIMDVQHEFLEKGVDKIKPLTLQEIADIVGVHEATVSRTTRGKYVQTPQGLFEFKYFFSPALKTASGGEQSSKSVRATIQKIIDAEDKRKPLSDQKITDKLIENGLKIARRTVTKYREAMNIPKTTMRKEYQS